MLFHMYQVFSSLLGHLHFSLHFFSTFMEHLCLNHPISHANLFSKCSAQKTQVVKFNRTRVGTTSNLYMSNASFHPIRAFKPQKNGKKTSSYPWLSSGDPPIYIWYSFPKWTKIFRFSFRNRKEKVIRVRQSNIFGNSK